MRDSEFRAKHMFAGTGVIEAGCKTLIGTRCKHRGCSGAFVGPLPSWRYAAVNSTAGLKIIGRRGVPMRLLITSMPCTHLHNLAIANRGYPCVLRKLPAFGAQPLPGRRLWSSSSVQRGPSPNRYIRGRVLSYFFPPCVNWLNCMDARSTFQISHVLVRFDSNTMVLPSRENQGWPSSPAAFVRSRA
jgi:hypothetical protein